MSLAMIAIASYVVLREKLLPILKGERPVNLVRRHLKEFLARWIGAIANVDKLTYAGNLANVADVASDDRYRFVRADICDRKAIGALFGEYDIGRMWPRRTAQTDQRPLLTQSTASSAPRPCPP